MLKKLMIAAIAAGALSTATAYAQHGPGGWHHDPLLSGITLTDAQKSRLDALHKANWQTNRSVVEQVHAVDEKIDGILLASGTVTEATLAPLVQQKQALLQQLASARLSEEIAVRNLLTDEQLASASSTHAQLASLHAQERALHAHGESSDGPPPPPDAN